MMLIALLFAAMIVGATVGIRTDVPPPPAATAVRTERESAKWKLPDCPDATTQRDLSLQTAESFARHLKEAYQTHGIPCPGIEPDLFAFFDDVAARYTSQPEHKSAEELLQQAEALRAAPCDDPGLIHCQGRLLQSSGHPARAIAHFLQAAARYDQLDYPPVLKARNAVSLSFSLGRLKEDPPAEQTAVWKTRAREYVAQSIAQGQLLPQDFRPLYELVKDYGSDIFDERDADGRRLLVARVEELGGGETWLGQLLAGRDHYDRAWDFRGTDLADKVTPEGWQGFCDHLAQAVPRLQAARELQPDFPESSHTLLSIAGLGHYNGPETRFDLFRQTLCAQFDYWPAYRALLWYARPRWGGSAAQAMDILRMVSESERYDTEVPEYALKLFKIVADDQDRFPRPYAAIGYSNLWQDARGWDLFRRTYEGYLRHEGPIPFERPTLARNLLNVAHQFDQPAEFLRIAREQLDSGLIDPAAFARFHGYSIPLAEAKAHLQLDQPDAWNRFVHALENRDFPQADVILREWETAAPAARAYLDCLRRTLLVRARLEPDADWLEQPAIPSLGLWIQRKGAWRAALDGAFLGATECNRNMILVHSSIAGGCEIAADVEILEAPAGEAPNAALIIARSPSTFVAFALYPDQNEVRLSRGNNKFVRTAPLPPAEDPARRRLRLRFEHGAFSAWIDGTPCFIDQRFPKMDADLSVRPGLGAFYHAENARCLFRNVRLRALAPAEFP